MRRRPLTPTAALDAGARRAVLAHCAEGGGREVCGLLFGRDGRPPALLTAVRLANRARRDDRFRASAREVWEHARSRAAAGERLLGVYHSHPEGDAVPSARDLAGAWGDLLQLIVAGPDEASGMACWSIEAGAALPVRLVRAEGRG